MNLEDYDFDRLLGLGYTEKATGDLKDACWKGYTAIGTKKKGGRTVPNCVPIKKSDHAEGMKRKPLIAGPSAGASSFGERGGNGKPCGGSHISKSKTCRVGEGPQRDPSKDIKRGNTIIGTSPRNKLIDNINEFKARLEDARSDAEREFLKETIAKAEAQLKAEGG